MQTYLKVNLEPLANKNVIVILDEVDAMGDEQAKSGIDIAKQVDDIIDTCTNFSFIAIANKIESIPAVTKSRLTNIIEIKKPNSEERKQILSYYLRRDAQKLTPACFDVNFLDELTNTTAKFSIRDIENLMVLARQEKYRRTRQAEAPIEPQDLLTATTKVQPALTLSDIWLRSKRIVEVLDQATRNPLIYNSIIGGIEYLNTQQGYAEPPVWKKYRMTERLLEMGIGVGREVGMKVVLPWLIHHAAAAALPAALL